MEPVEVEPAEVEPAEVEPAEVEPEFGHAGSRSTRQYRPRKLVLRSSAVKPFMALD